MHDDGRARAGARFIFNPVQTAPGGSLAGRGWHPGSLAAGVGAGGQFVAMLPGTGTQLAQTAGRASGKGSES
eukprot:COSAG03_NODE_90_length_13417_cov_11.032512_17_plen_72_part_00